MEGIGYWLIIAALYLLSSLMKQRKQKAARQALEQEDLVLSSDKEPSPLQPNFIQNMFGDLRNMVEDFDIEGIQADDDSAIVESGELMEQESEPIIIETDLNKPEESEFTHLSEKTLKPTHTKHKYWQKKTIVHHRLGVVLKNKNSLKNAIVLKEILDKPRAMRKTIR